MSTCQMKEIITVNIVFDSFYGNFYLQTVVNHKVEERLILF